MLQLYCPLVYRHRVHREPWHKQRSRETATPLTGVMQQRTYSPVSSIRRLTVSVSVLQDVIIMPLEALVRVLHRLRWKCDMQLCRAYWVESGISPHTILSRLTKTMVKFSGYVFLWTECTYNKLPVLRLLSCWSQIFYFIAALHW